MRDPYVREIVSKLKQDIAARVVESRALHARARAVRGEERHEIQMERRAFGRVTRWALLAYAFVRARPYARAEPRAVVPVDVWAVKRLLGGLGAEVDAAEIGRWRQAESPGGTLLPRPTAPPETATLGGQGAQEGAG